LDQFQEEKEFQG